MGERKVLNKYYPPDFDPAKIPKRKQSKNQQMKVRMMIPMSIRCNTCGTYIYKGTKFNSRKEDVIGQAYLGIQIFRFYFNCTKCSAELTIKTDSQNSDYVVESGAARNFEPWRAEDESTESLKRKKDAEEMGDAMKSLENRALVSKQDMDILAALEEMKSMKSRHATVSVDDMLEALKRSAYEKKKKIMDEIDKADEEVIKSITFPGSKDFVRRIQDDEDEDLDDDWHRSLSSLSQSSDNTLKESISGLPRVVVWKPTDTLTKASIFSKVGEALGGSLVSKPKFIAKPRSAAKDDTRLDKKLRIEPEAEEKTKKDGERQSKASSGSEMASGLQSLFQNYDRDKSD